MDNIIVKAMPLGPLGANCYTVCDTLSGECAVIDPGGYTQELENALNDKRIGKLKYILLTHGHFDHISGVAELKEKHPEMKVCIHVLDAECLNNPRMSLADGFAPGTFKKGVNADVLLHDGDKLYLGQNEISVISAPGHTRGGVTYKLGDLLFTGDTLFRFTYGRSDFFGGSPADLERSIYRLFALDGDYTVYPGHNISTTLSYEREHNRILRGIR